MTTEPNELEDSHIELLSKTLNQIHSNPQAVLRMLK
jgi:hypothetical protein